MRKLLLIEDDLFFRQMLKDLLKIEGFEVVTASNGSEGIRLFKEHRPEIVITDIIMPEKEGTETIIELKAIDSKVKIIAISGGGRAGFVDYLDTAKEFGVNAAFSKPFNNKAFIAKIKELLD